MSAISGSLPKYFAHISVKFILTWSGKVIIGHVIVNDLMFDDTVIPIIESQFYFGIRSTIFSKAIYQVTNSCNQTKNLIDRYWINNEFFSDINLLNAASLMGKSGKEPAWCI